jgi:hypothetical protein
VTGRVDHQLIARAQPGLCERQSAEPILLERIRAGEVDDEVGR